MRITLDSTQSVISVEEGGDAVLARVWEGHADDGTPIMAWIVRVSPQTHDPDVAAKFGRDLVETARPSMIVPSRPIPLRFIL